MPFAEIIILPKIKSNLLILLIFFSLSFLFLSFSLYLLLPFYSGSHFTVILSIFGVHSLLFFCRSVLDAEMYFLSKWNINCHFKDFDQLSHFVWIFLISEKRPSLSFLFHDIPNDSLNVRTRLFFYFLSSHCFHLHLFLLNSTV